MAFLTKKEIYPNHSLYKERNIQNTIEASNNYHELRKVEEGLLKEKNICQYKIDRNKLSMSNLFEKMFLTIVNFPNAVLISLILITLSVGIFNGWTYWNNKADLALLEKKYNHQLDDYKNKLLEISKDSVEKFPQDEYGRNKYFTKEMNKIPNGGDFEQLINIQHSFKKSISCLTASAILFLVLFFLNALIWGLDILFNNKPAKNRIVILNEELAKLNNFRQIHKDNYLYGLEYAPELVNKNLKDYLNYVYQTTIKDLSLLNKRSLDSVYCEHSMPFFSKNIDGNSMFNVKGNEHFNIILSNTNYYQRKMVSK